MTYDALVIGAGHNGLTAAAYLGRAGLRVLVLERRDHIGGSASTEEIFSGFHADTCAHRIYGIHPSVTRDLSLARHGFQLQVPSACVFAPTLDGPALTLWSAMDRTVASIRQHSSRDATRWSAFVALVGLVARFVRLLYQRPPVNAPTPTLTDSATLVGVVRAFTGLTKGQRADLLRVIPASVAELLDERFDTDLLKGIAAAVGTIGLMQGPLGAGTAYTLFHHHAYAPPGMFRPALHPHGGMGTLSRALAAAAGSAGVRVRTAAPVETICVKDGRAVGVVLEGGEEILARSIISSADPRHTLLTLLDPVNLGTDVVRHVKSVRFRGAIAKVNLALGELPRFSGVTDNDELSGTIVIAPNIEYLERAYDDAKYGRVSSNLAMDISIPTLANPEMAPAGRHVLSATVQYVPYHRQEGAWTDDHRKHLGERVLETLAAYAPNVPGAVEHLQVITPRDLEVQYGLTEGNPNHGELTLDQLYFMRPIAGWAQYRTPIPNLFLCGAGTHAGGGVTCAAGFNASRVVAKAIKRS